MSDKNCRCEDCCVEKYQNRYWNLVEKYVPTMTKSEYENALLRSARFSIIVGSPVSTIKAILASKCYMGDNDDCAGVPLFTPEELDEAFAETFKSALIPDPTEQPEVSDDDPTVPIVIVPLPTSLDLSPIDPLATAPVNDYVCFGCGNDKCSATEKSCWKCGKKIGE